VQSPAALNVAGLTAPSFERTKGRMKTQSLRSSASGVTAAALVSACVLVAGADASLPALGGAAVFLFFAVERDVSQRRIPNWLTFPSFALALAYAALTGGLAEVGSSLLGAVVALGILLVPYSFGWLGAGDVKAMVVIGALWGAGVALAVIAWALGLGGVIAIVWVALRGRLRDLAVRWTQSFLVSIASRRWTYFPPAPDSVEARGVPFAVAIGLAVASYQIWGSPWA
jgi:prepilin peptidase CpaA